MGQEFFRLEGCFERSGEKAKVVAKYQVGDRKEFERNGAPVERLSDHVGQFPVVMIAPDDITLVQDGSEDRRRFLDTTLSQISSEYLQNLLIYNALLKQRNALLKAFFEQRQYDPIRWKVSTGKCPVRHRYFLSIAKSLQPGSNHTLPTSMPLFQAVGEQVDVDYQSDLEKGNLGELLPKCLEKDRALQRTTVWAAPRRPPIHHGWVDGEKIRFSRPTKIIPAGALDLHNMKCCGSKWDKTPSSCSMIFLTN